MLAIISVSAFTLLYFVHTFIQSKKKYFWYDELFTVYLCRLSTLGETLRAVRAGVDFNQPLLYLLTRASNAAFGEGLFVTRLPGIVGFWGACLSIFYFIDHTYGLGPGVLSMVTPLITGAEYYSCEARSYGTVLGLSGLALVSWQRSLELPLPNLWILAFSIFLMAAFMTHCYSLLITVPFVLAELADAAYFKQFDWSIWIAVVTPTLIACVSFVPSIRSYKELTKGTTFPALFPARPKEIPKIYSFLFEPAVPFLLGIICLFVLQSGASRSLVIEPRQLLIGAVIPAIGFLGLPLFAVLLGKTAGGPVLPRYCIPAILGLCLLIGMGAGTRNMPNWMAVSLAGAIVAVKIRSRIKRRTSTQNNALAMHSLLKTNSTTLPIVVLDPLEFLYLIHYAPVLMSRLYYLSLSKTDINFRAFENLKKWCFLDYNQSVTFDEFFRMKLDFYLYGPGSLIIRGLSVALGANRKLELLVGRQDHFLAEIRNEKR